LCGILTSGRECEASGRGLRVAGASRKARRETRTARGQTDIGGGSEGELGATNARPVPCRIWRAKLALTPPGKFLSSILNRARMNLLPFALRASSRVLAKRTFLSRTAPGHMPGWGVHRSNQKTRLLIRVRGAQFPAASLLRVPSFPAHPQRLCGQFQPEAEG